MLSDLTSGPFIAGYLSMTGPEGWRWLFWLLTIFGGISTLVLYFTMPETYAPIILHKKAREVREKTGDTLVYANIERGDQTILELLKVTLTRPFQLLFGDIIIFLVCLYLSFCCGVQYLFFQVAFFILLVFLIFRHILLYFKISMGLALEKEALRLSPSQ